MSKKWITSGILKAILSGFFLAGCPVIWAQSSNDYFLLPGGTLLLPEGQSVPLSIHFFSGDGTIKEGVNSYQSELPKWSVNGRPWSSSPPPSGTLRVNLGFERAIFTAPEKIPAQNPVILSVSFHASDSSKTLVILLCSITIVAPSPNWLVTFHYESFRETSDISATQSHHYRCQKTGAAAMEIRPEDSGPGDPILINTQDDSLLWSTTSGAWKEEISNESRDLSGHIESRDIRHHSGKVTTQKPGFEFEYDPQPGGTKGLAGTGLDYDEEGTDAFTKTDDLNHLVTTTEAVHNSYGTNILLGSSEDHLQKTPDGYQIDYSATRDTTFTDMQGVAHHSSSSVQYHVTLSRKKRLKGHSALAAPKKRNRDLRVPTPDLYFAGQAPDQAWERVSPRGFVFREFCRLSYEGSGHSFGPAPHYESQSGRSVQSGLSN